MIEYDEPAQGAHPNPNQWWFHRRIMAYASLAGVLMTLVAACFGAIPEPAMQLVEGLCWILGFVVVAYYANNGLEAFAKVRR